MANKFAEIAGIKNGRDWTRGWLGMDSYLPSTDRLLSTKASGDLQLYEEVAQDAQVKSCLQQRFRGLISHNWEVLPGGEQAIDKAAAEMVHGQLMMLRWDDIVEKMLWGTFYGYSVAEVLWQKQGDLVGIQDIRVRNRRRFHFDIDQQPRLKTFDSPFGEVLPDRKFWHFCCGAADDDEPYGRGLAHWLYWLVFFKKVDLRWWVRYLELYAQPTRVGKYPAGSDDKAKKVLWQALGSFGVDDQIMIPEGMMVELLEAGRAGTADYDTLHSKLDEAIAKVILSQTMTTDNGSSMSQAQVHQDVSETIIEADADLIATSFNTSVIPWLVAYNYPGQQVALPKFAYKIENAPDLVALVDRDAKIAALGYPPTAEYVASTYGDGFQRGDAENLTAQLPDGQITSLAGLIGQALNGSWAVELVRSVMDMSYPAIAPEQKEAFLKSYKQSIATAQKQQADAAAAPEDLGTLFAAAPSPGELALPIAAAEPFRPWFEQLQELLASSADLAEFGEAIDKAFPDLDEAEFAQLMADAATAASLGGYSDSKENK